MGPAPRGLAASAATGGKLDPDLVIIDAVLVRAFGGGDLTGPSPVDRRKKRSKHTLRSTAWSAAGHPHGGSQCQRPPADHPAGEGLPQGDGQAGSAQGVAR